MTLDGKGTATVRVRSTFEPEKVVIDPDVKVLQLRRKLAELKREGHPVNPAGEARHVR